MLRSLQRAQMETSGLREDGPTPLPKAIQTKVEDLADTVTHLVSVFAHWLPKQMAEIPHFIGLSLEPTSDSSPNPSPVMDSKQLHDIPGQPTKRNTLDSTTRRLHAFEAVA